MIYDILKSSPFKTKLSSNSQFSKQQFIFSIKVLKYLPVWMYATVFYYICVRIYLRVKKEKTMNVFSKTLFWFGFLKKNNYKYILLFFIFITRTLEENKQKQTKENNNNNNVQKNNQSIIKRQLPYEKQITKNKILS